MLPVFQQQEGRLRGFAYLNRDKTMIEEVSDMPVVLFAAYLAVAVAVYFLPTFLANWRDVRRVSFITVVNLLLGWTVIGWLVLLAMAALGERGPGAGFHRRAYEQGDDSPY